MTTRKKQPPAPNAAPYVPSDYEQGVLDTLQWMKGLMDDLRAAERRLDAVTYDDRTAREFMGGIHHVNHIVDGVRIKLESLALQKLSERRAQQRDATPAGQTR